MEPGTTSTGSSITSTSLTDPGQGQQPHKEHKPLKSILKQEGSFEENESKKKKPLVFAQGTDVESDEDSKDKKPKKVVIEGKMGVVTGRLKANALKAKEEHSSEHDESADHQEEEKKKESQVKELTKEEKEKMKKEEKERAKKERRDEKEKLKREKKEEKERLKEEKEKLKKTK
eukprot:TRINITY_DN2401_c0_g1_i1.p1 TRINITY_DN2401_c0_g1~~TRINITY_DN2401_c0_g1_i1.p1  ORF type:complete len:174 (-),score=62.97 TRINITY_DN2401_c0_g1_i1:256-777(-)